METGTVRSAKNRGQLIGGVAENMLSLLVIVAIAFVTIIVAQNLLTNMSTGLTGSAQAAQSNFIGERT